MELSKIVLELKKNHQVIKNLLMDLTEEEFTWKSSPEKWSLLEIICHLYDEEREDFRARLRHVLDELSGDFPSINPPVWVEERKYSEKNYSETLSNFLTERENSIEWLNSLSSPNWDNYYIHPKFGKMTAKMFLSNWLAHDYLHIKQILKVKFEYLKTTYDEPLSYAGEW